MARISLNAKEFVFSCLLNAIITSHAGPMVILFCLEFLLVLLGQPAVQASLCNQDNITFLSYFPCTDLPEGNASHFVETCDLLTYVAARVAMDEINSREDILNGSFVNLVPFATRKVSC